MSTGCMPAWIRRAAWCAGVPALLLTAAAAAGPVQVETPRFSLAVPEGFTDLTSPSGSTGTVTVVRYDLGQRDPDTWLTIHAADGEPDLFSPADPGRRELEPYKEFWRDTLLDVRTFTLATGDVQFLERSVRIPWGPEVIGVTLRSSAMQDAQMRATIHELLQTLELKTPDESAGLPSWTQALIYLALAAVVIVVAFARFGGSARPPVTH
jgi:hypothetical protein